MAVEILVNVDIARLLASLEALKRAARLRIARSALRAASKPILRRAKELAPVMSAVNPRVHRRPGVLKNSLAVLGSKKARGSGGVVGVYIGARVKKGVIEGNNNPLDPYYYRFVELGHRIVPKGKVTKSRKLRSSNGRVAGRYFLRDAANGLEAESAALFSASFVNRLQVELDR